jgi:hypothetical protein
MKPGIMDLGKWTAKTSLAVEQICKKKQAPCVGFSLVFFDPMAPPEERWNYVIELAFDPRNPPSDKEREELEKSFEFISDGIRRIMGDGEEQNTTMDSKWVQ